MATIEYQRFRQLCKLPAGEHRLIEEKLGWNGAEEVYLFVDTNGGGRLRFFITSGVYLEQTFQMNYVSLIHGKDQMRNVAIAWIRNTPRFSGLSAYPDIERELETA